MFSCNVKLASTKPVNFLRLIYTCYIIKTIIAETLVDLGLRTISLSCL